MKIDVYSERIIPEKTFAGALASHLKRYDFAKQFCKDKVVLDAACGVGYGSCCLAGVAKEVISVDISEEAIAYAKEHYQRENIQFKIMEIHSFLFADKYFDIVCSFETIEHLDEPQRYLTEVKRVLNEDAIFIVSTPNVKKTPYNPKNYYHKTEFSKRDFEALLNKYFAKVEIFGQTRLQSLPHYYIQKLDIFHLRSLLSDFLRRKICHTMGTHSWDEVDIRDFAITKEGIKRATDLIGVCRK